MLQVIRVSDETQSHYQNLVVNGLQKPSINFYNRVPHKHDYRTTSDEARVAESFEQFLVNALGIIQTLINEGIPNTPTLRAFAAFASATEILSRYPKTKVEPLILRVDENADTTSLYFIQFTRAYAEKFPSDLTGYEQKFFNGILLWALNVAERNKHDAIIYDKFAIEIGSVVVHGFRIPDNHAIKKLGNVSWDKIIGNTEIKIALAALVDDLLCYDIGLQKNPVNEIYAIPTTIMLDGPPGTGKTLTLKAMVNYFIDRAVAINKGNDIGVFNIDTSIMSKYKGETANNLRQIFDDATNVDKISIIVIEDIDALFPSRDELGDQPEDKQVFHELINAIRGLMTDNHGNYVVVATSNKPGLLDAALLQRFNEVYHVQGPKTVAELAQIAEITLKDKFRNYDNHDGALVKFGEVAKSFHLVGRDVDNIVQMFVSDVIRQQRHSQSVEFYKMPYTSQVKILRDSFQFNGHINTICDYVVNYAKSHALMEEKIQQERVRQIVDAHNAQVKAESIIKSMR